MTMTERRLAAHSGRGLGHAGGSRSRAVRASRGLVLGLAALGGTAVLSVLLTRVSARALLPLSRWSAEETATGRLEHLFVGAVAAVGALVAAWYALSALVGLLCALAQLCGATWRAGEQVLRKHGAPGVGRILGAGAGAVLAAGLSLTPAQAGPPEPTPEPTLAEDLTWAAAARETTEQDGSTPGGPASGEPGEGHSPATSGNGPPDLSGEAPSASAEAPEPTMPSAPASDPTPTTQAG